jgi:hypothetical protein
MIHSPSHNIGNFPLQPDLWPTYDPSLPCDAVLGCGCRPPSALIDDWRLLDPADYLYNPAFNDESIRVSVGDVDIAVDRNALGRNLVCQFCHGRGAARSWALWTRRAWGLEERLEEIEERLCDVEIDQAVRRPCCAGVGRGFGCGGGLRHGHPFRGRPVFGAQRFPGHGVLHGGGGFGLRQPGGVNIGHVDVFNGPLYQRNRRVMRNNALLQHNRHGF